MGVTLDPLDTQHSSTPFCLATLGLLSEFAGNKFCRRLTTRFGHRGKFAGNKYCRGLTLTFARRSFSATFFSLN